MHRFRASAAGLALAAGLAVDCLVPVSSLPRWNEVEIGSREFTPSIHAPTDRGGHWHGHHTGGNENSGGTGSLIVARDSVRARMTIENVSTISDRTTPPSPEGALPVVTFDDEVTFHVNGGTVLIAGHGPVGDLAGRASVVGLICPTRRA